MAARVSTKYESNDGEIHSIGLSADRAAVAGTAPTGAINNSIKAKISKTNGEYGLRPRGVVLTRTVGTAPDTFKKYAFLPVLTAAEYNSAAFAIGVEITIGLIVWTIVSKVPEDY